MLRGITGLLYVAILVGALLLGPSFFYPVLLLFTVLSLNEFGDILKKSDLIVPSKWLMITAGTVFFISSVLHSIGFWQVAPYHVFPGLVIIILVLELFKNKKYPIVNSAVTIFGVVYIAIPLSLLNYLSSYPGNSIHEYTPVLVLGFFILLWTYDTFAFLTGISMGKNLLFERLSPKKTWEGAIGGFLFTLFSAYLISLFTDFLPLLQWLIIGAIIALFATFGDLIESMFKRSLHLKDSGKVLPGHGGLLDRLDSVLVAAPAVFVYIEINKIFIS
jgi:phosphatidate cytidylyltransferase